MKKAIPEAQSGLKCYATMKRGSPVKFLDSSLISGSSKPLYVRWGNASYSIDARNRCGLNTSSNFMAGVIESDVNKFGVT